MNIVTALWIAFNAGLFLVMLFEIEYFIDVGLAWLNPIFLYKNIKVNKFGAGFIAFIGNVLFPPFAVVYWLCKLCTVGRK